MGEAERAHYVLASVPFRGLLASTLLEKSALEEWSSFKTSKPEVEPQYKY